MSGNGVYPKFADFTEFSTSDKSLKHAWILVHLKIVSTYKILQVRIIFLIVTIFATEFSEIIEGKLLMSTSWYLAVSQLRVISVSTPETDENQWLIQDFPDEEVNPRGEGVKLLFGKIFAENCTKVKEIGARGQWRVPNTPLIFLVFYKRNQFFQIY